MEFIISTAMPLAEATGSASVDFFSGAVFLVDSVPAVLIDSEKA
jgi:hypothetical protein